MKCVVLAALIAVVACSRLSNEVNDLDQQWPWKVGRLYRYDVETYTLARLPEGASTGNAFKARLILRAKAPGHLQAKLEDPENANVHQTLFKDQRLPSDLKYQAVKDLDKPFEIKLEGGRVKSLNAPSSLSLAHENLLKGVISALQVDLSTHRNEHSQRNTFDRQTRQGQFKKMETDVTGDCETLYTVSPVASEWRRELPNFSLKQDPIEITKSKNYDHCHHRVAYNFGVPEGAEWTGTAQYGEEQFISRSTTSRILYAGHVIYKAEATSVFIVHPLLYGKQKAEVLSKVQLNLKDYEEDKEPEWQNTEESRQIKNLLYAVAKKSVAVTDESASRESHEQLDVEQLSQNRVRRDTFKKTITVKKIKMTRHRRDQTENSWEQSNESPERMDDNARLYNDPEYRALYMDPQPEQDVKQNTANVQRLVQELAQQLANPSNMPKADFLTKFNILVRLISSMSYEQLQQTSRSIEPTKSSNNIVKSDMWMVYRDAVAQSGNLSAFRQILSWIEKKQIEGEEAAEVIATLVYSLRYPTKDVMMQFFKLAMSPEVREQKYMNTTALIAATRLINLGQVNNNTAHYYYPTHMHGRLADRHDKFVLKDVIPPLVQELEKALREKDSGKAQVYIKAIGNLGHRQILDVFAPYLEGKIPVSTYLRSHMIQNLQILAYEQDKYVRNVMYSIVRNTAEPWEVRVLAIRILFMAYPSPAMMQAMAQMTHDDPSMNVRAALKVSIQAVAQVKNPRFTELALSAQAVQSMLTKEELSNQYSMTNDFYDKEHGFQFTSFLDFIGSEDSLLPKHLLNSVRNKAGQWNEVKGSISSVQQFLNYVQQQLSRMQKPHQRSEPNHKYSANKITDMLKIKRDPQGQLEADLNIDLMGQERYFTFSEDELNKLPIIMRDMMTNYKQGIEKHYTKVFNQNKVQVMIPTAAGMPFIYSYKEPTVIHIQGKVKGDINFAKMPKRLDTNIEKEIQITFARNIDGSVGFYDTLANKYAIAGVVNKVQLNIPVKIEMQLKSGEVKIRLSPLHPEQDTTIGHFSVWPYTASQNKNSLVPVSLDKNTKPISRNYKVSSIDYKFGQNIGTLFQFQGYSYSKDYSNFAGMIRSSNPWANIALMMSQKDIALTHYNFRYLGKQSTSKGITVTATYDTLYNQKQASQNPFVASKVQDVTPNSAGRREELIKRAVSGIKIAKAKVLDLSATFETPQKSEYVFTAAIGMSPVDPKIQYTVFAGKNSADGQNQMNIAGTVRKPEITAMNYLEALKKDLKMSFDAEIKYGADESGSVKINGYTERSKKHTEELQKHPLAKKAAEEIAKNNYYQDASHRMLIMAHAPDYMKASITYNNVSPAFRYMIFQAYKLAEGFGYLYTNVNPLKTLPDGKIELEAQTAYWEDRMSTVLKSRYGEVQIKNVPIPRTTASALSFYLPFKLTERVANAYTRHQYQPYCSVDDNKIRTFSDRIYKYELSSSWHVVMQDAPRPENAQFTDQLVVLARKPSQRQQEIYISYQSNTGKDLEIEIKPAQGANKADVRVKTNTKKVSDGDLTTYWDDEEDTSFLEYFNYHDGVLMLRIREDRLRVMYDGQRLVLLASEGRNNTRGICGYMNGEPRDDYMTPYGLVDQPEHYGASYALNDENTDPKTQKLQQEAKEVAYQREYKKTNVLRSDRRWQQSMEESSEEVNQRSENVYRSRAYSKEQGPCQLKQQVQYYENHGEICITTEPMNACQSHCLNEGYSVKSVQVVCRPKLDQKFQQYKSEIQQGQNPRVSGISETKMYRVPVDCKA